MTEHVADAVRRVDDSPGLDRAPVELHDDRCPIAGDPTRAAAAIGR